MLNENYAGAGEFLPRLALSYSEKFSIFVKIFITRRIYSVTTGLN